MKTINELYSPEEISRLEIKKKKWRAVFWCIALGALAGCVGLALGTRTANEPQMQRSAILLSTAAGWVDLYIRRFVISALGHEITHAGMLLESERQSCEGVLTVTKERLRIRNSVTIRMLQLENGGKPQRVKVIETKVGALEALNGRRVRLWTANGYAAAWEEL